MRCISYKVTPHPKAQCYFMTEGKMIETERLRERHAHTYKHTYDFVGNYAYSKTSQQLIRTNRAKFSPSLYRNKKIHVKGLGQNMLLSILGSVIAGFHCVNIYIHIPVNVICG